MKKIILILSFIVGTLFILGSANPNGAYNSGFNPNLYQVEPLGQGLKNYNYNQGKPDTPYNHFYDKNYNGYTPYGYKSKDGMIYNY